MQHRGTGQNRTPSLSPKQELALRALLAGATNTEAAKQAGVQRSTLAVWQEQPQFQAELRTALAEMRDAVAREVLAAHREVLQAKLKGVRALVAVAEDQEASAADRTRAARGLADLKLPELPTGLPARAWTAAEVEREQERLREGKIRDLASSLQLGATLAPLVESRFMAQAAGHLGLTLPGLSPS